MEETEPETRLKSESSDKLVNFRKALFQCHCGKEFRDPARIDLIKMQKIKSCGCLQPESVREYHRKVEKAKEDYRKREVKNEA